jgi:hypothetical protein
MSLIRSGIAVNFTGGDYSTTNKDANGFWLDITTYASNTRVETNDTVLDVGTLTLRHAFTGTQFTNFTLYVYLRAEFRLNGVLTYKYLFGDSNGASVGSKSMTGGSTTLISGASIVAVTIPHNADGSRPDVVVRGYCDSTSTATYVPASTTANTGSIVFDDLPVAKRYDSSGYYQYTNSHLRYDGTHWVNTATRYRYDGTHWINLS